MWNSFEEIFRSVENRTGRIWEGWEAFSVGKTVEIQFVTQWSVGCTRNFRCGVGVDIERIRRYHSATARKLFTEEEQVMLEQVESEEARNALFTRLWTEWEAVLKLEGSGFAGGWRENGVDKARYAIWTKEMDGYFLSVATREATLICLVEDEQHRKC